MFTKVARIVVAVVCATALLPGCVAHRPEPIAPARSAAALETRSLTDARLDAFLRSATANTAGTRVWNLETLTLAAVYFHPDLEVAYARLAVARAAIITAGQRPNPTLSLSALYDSPPPLTIGFALDFLLETFGRRGARTAQAQALADAARQDVATAAWQVRGSVRAALLDLWAAQRRAEFGRSRLQLEAQLVGLLERRLALGEASALDVARERINRDQFTIAVRDADSAALTARARLATAIGVPARALDGVAIDLTAFDVPPNLDAHFGEGELRGRALTGRTDVQASLAQYAAAQSALRLALAGRYPNVALAPGYTYDQGVHKIGLSGISLELPIFNRNQGPIAEAVARRTQAAANFTALQAQIIGAIDTAAVAYRTAGQAVATTTALLDAQQRRQARTAKLFAAGEIDRPTLLTGSLEVGAIQLSTIDSAIAQRQALGAIEDALQQPLFDPRSTSPTDLVRRTAPEAR